MSVIVPFIVLNPYFWLVAAAVLPALVLLVFVYKHDRLERESGRLLLILLGLGVVATYIAQITEALGMAAISMVSASGSTVYNVLLYFVVVAVSEEGLKYWLMKRATWRNREFNCLFDGIVYAVFVSLGFALWENISYVMTYGMSAAAARAVTAVPGHASFGVFMGIFYGFARRAEMNADNEKSRKLRKLSLLVPVLLHGAYDYCAMMQNGAFTLGFLALVIVMFITAFRMVKKFSREDTYI